MAEVSSVESGQKSKRSPKKEEPKAEEKKAESVSPPSTEKPAFKLSDLVPKIGGHEVVFPPFEELTLFVYGDQGTGKTTFFGNSGCALILATEPGAQFQEDAGSRLIRRFAKDEVGKQVVNEKGEITTVYDRRLDFCTMVAGIEAANREGLLRERGVKLVVIDTADRLYQQACEWLCEVNSVATIGDIPYGKGYALAMENIRREIRKLQAIIPVAFISHAMTVTEELESESGIKKEVEKKKPSVDRRFAEWLAGEQNIVAYTYKSADGKYLVKFHTDHRLETKDRTGLLEALKKPLTNDWKGVVAAYEAQAKAKGITLKSRWA